MRENSGKGKSWMCSQCLQRSRNDPPLIPDLMNTKGERPQVKEGGGADRGAGESERGNMTGIKVGRGGGDSGRFDQGRAKSRTVPSLFFQAWLLRAQRFKGLAYFRSLSRLLLREIEYFQRRFYTPPRGKMLFDIGLRLRHFVSHLFESFDKSSTISDYTVDS